MTGGYVISDIGPTLVAQGFVVVNVSYRLGGTAAWPAQIEDVKSAIRYLRTYAKQFDINPHEIGAWGHSAGGHLVSLLGVAPRKWDAGPYSAQPSNVEAVVDLSGPSDLNSMRHESASALVKDTFISLLRPVPANVTAALKKASPVTYVGPKDPPFLIVAGEDDQFVFAEQASEFANALQAKRVAHTLILVKGSGHDLNQAGQDPSPATIAATVVSFFKAKLHFHSVGSSS